MKTLPMMMFVAAVLAFTAHAANAQTSHKQKPAVTMKQARAAALASVSNGKIKSSELEHEDGQFIYSFDIKVGSGIKEVWVDAMTGKVTRTVDETPAGERKEAAQDRAAKHRGSGK